jgi:hypothetical protein
VTLGDPGARNGKGGRTSERSECREELGRDRGWGRVSASERERERGREIGNAVTARSEAA